MKNLYDAQFTFNSSGSLHTRDEFKVFYDNQGNLINRSKRPFGFYNKIIQISYSRLWYITKHTIGLGDIIDFFTKTLYIKQFLVYITNGNCGCESRRILFNKWVQIPYFKLNNRIVYMDDENIINEIKKIKKTKKHIPTRDSYMEKHIRFIGLTGNTQISNLSQKMEKITQNAQSAANPDSINNPAPTPVKPSGGCGCSRRNK